MDLYLVSRTSAWHSEEELEAGAECMPAQLAALGDDIRWIRSYVYEEADGTFSADCLFEAPSAERLEELADASMLPADRIRRLHSVGTP
jgi:hypothetical protein